MIARLAAIFTVALSFVVTIILAVVFLVAVLRIALR